ncbi:hypothetical protein ACFX13_039256 [Malus domestica]
MANEETNCLSRRRRGKKGFMSLKLDTSKAYDRIEWSYLRSVLRLGFSLRWTDLIMTCVTSVTYFVMVNGSPRGYLHPTRGLRQGDPFSPFLFLLCAEGLSALIARQEREGWLRGVTICRGAPPITHLLFVDDCLIFTRATLKDCNRIRAILHDYERA